jgi:hypothetical protein
MNAGDEAVGPAARLAETRAQLQLLFDPAVGVRPGRLLDEINNQFPRSATFRFLVGRPGKSALGLLLLGLLATHRASLGRWGRYLSAGGIVARALISRANGRRGSQR